MRRLQSKRKAVQDGGIRRDRVQDYLRASGYEDAEVLAFEPLGGDVQEDLKALGYGCPVRVRFRASGAARDIVIRTGKPDIFGHDRRADRLYQMALCADTFRHIPQHIQALDAGTLDADGAFVSLGDGEPYLITDYVEGELYAHDLKALEHADAPGSRDLLRVRRLATYLADLHSEPATAVDYRRRLRDTIGDGEGIFGIVDAYPADLKIVPPKRLQAIEKQCIDWRWKLKERAHRSRRTHGDFHPFNLLFRAPDDLSVLDCSRGGVGEPADDVACLTINYLFFALVARGRFEGALRTLWDELWATYLEATKDYEILEVVAPFFAWRALVLACPVWYPTVKDDTRDRVLTFAERLLAGAPFVPDQLEEVLS